MTNSTNSHSTGPNHKKPILMTLGLAIVLLLVVFAFIFLPVAGIAAPSPGQKINFAKYEGKSIDFSSSNTFGRRLSQYSSYFGQNITYLLDFTYKSILEEEYILHRLEDTKFQVSSDRLANLIIEDPEFLDENGNFNQELYRNLPKGNRNALKSSIERQTLIEKFHNAHSNGIYRSENSKQLISRLGEQQRIFDYAFSSADNYPSDLVQNYSTQNADLFNEIELERITLSAEATLSTADLITQLQTGEIDFASSAKEMSQDAWKESGGYIGLLPNHEAQNQMSLDDENWKTLQTTTEEYVSLINTDKNRVIFHILQPWQEPDYNNTAVIDDIRNYIINNDYSVIEEYYKGVFAKLAESSNSTTSFLDNGITSNLTVGSTLPMTLNIKNSEFLPPMSEAWKERTDNNLSSNFDQEKSLLTSLFSLEKAGDNTGFTTKQNAEGELFIIFRLSEIITADTTNTVENFDETLKNSYNSAINDIMKSSPSFIDNSTEGTNRLLRQANS